MTTRHSSFLLSLMALLGFAFLQGGIHAYETGAQTCRGQLPAVLDADLDAYSRTIDAGFFADAGISLKIANITLDPRSKIITEFPTGSNLPVVVTASKLPIRGILLRIARVDEVSAKGALTAGPLLETASVCQAPVTGVTNKDYTAKPNVTATVRFNETTFALLEVTVVLVDSPEAFAFVYDSFALGFVAPPKPAPVVVKPTPVASGSAKKSKKSMKKGSKKGTSDNA
jgi:hypothetical protein